VTVAEPRVEVAVIEADELVSEVPMMTGTVTLVAPAGIVTDADLSCNIEDEAERVVATPPEGAGEARRTVKLTVDPTVEDVDGKKRPMGRGTLKAVSVSVWLFSLAITVIGVGTAPTGNGHATLPVVEPAGIVREVGKPQPGTSELIPITVGIDDGELSVTLTCGLELLAYHFWSRLTATVIG